MVHLFDYGFTWSGAILRIMVVIGIVTTIWLGWSALGNISEWLSKRYPRIEPIYSFLALGTVVTGFVFALR
jgi:hypothetical protein